MSDLFNEKQRRVFLYHNGESEVYGDPLAIQRKLRAYMGGDCKKVVDAINSDNAIEVDAAADVFHAAVVKAFDIKRVFDPKTGDGFTEADLRKLWDIFQKWLSEKKNPPASGPTSPPVG